MEEQSIRTAESIKIGKAKLRDIPEIQRLVNSFADRGDMLHRPLGELFETVRDFFVLRNEQDEVVACAALHVNWGDLAEVKSVAVNEEQQGHGYGRLLVEACLADARELEVPTVFALTYRPGFFQSLGFQRVDVEQLPRKVWGECYRCHKFPHCDETALVYQLSPADSSLVSGHGYGYHGNRPTAASSDDSVQSGVE